MVDIRGCQSSLLRGFFLDEKYVFLKTKSDWLML